MPNKNNLIDATIAFKFVPFINRKSLVHKARTRERANHCYSDNDLG
jgi:hypothetical protein